MTGLIGRRARSVGLLAVTAGLLAACQPPLPPPSPVVAPAEPAGLQRRPIPPSGVHVVAHGETLSEIAYIYDVPLSRLARANVVGDVNVIHEGQVLDLRRRAPPSHAPRARDDAITHLADAGDGEIGSGADGSDVGTEIGGDLPLRVIITPASRDADVFQRLPSSQPARLPTTPPSSVARAR
ncbi:MAG: LysM domain-containing protein [Pseudomonadota bacterium]